MNLTERDYVQKLVKKYKTQSPYELVKCLGITLQRKDLGSVLGYYYKAYRIKYIVLNTSLEPGSPTDKYVLSHEIGHSVMHPNTNAPFLQTHTYLSVNKMEMQANKFAMEFLISDDILLEYIKHQGYTIEQISRLLGYRKELIELRLK